MSKNYKDWVDPNEKWININDNVPEYYECVFAEMQTGDVLELWRASNGERDIYTQYETDRVFYHNEIIRWKRYKLKTKE